MPFSSVEEEEEQEEEKGEEEKEEEGELFIQKSRAVSLINKKNEGWAQEQSFTWESMDESFYFK